MKKDTKLSFYIESIPKMGDGGIRLVIIEQKVSIFFKEKAQKGRKMDTKSPLRGKSILFEKWRSNNTIVNALL